MARAIGSDFFSPSQAAMETVETVLPGFYLHIAHDLNRGLCESNAKNGFNHLKET
jgi:hypothetical protein